MPYIKKEDRDKFWHNGTCLLDMALLCETPGDLNYAITIMIHEYIFRHGQSYSTYNEAMGILECAKMELYRKHIAPYEEEKIKENGDL